MKLLILFVSLLCARTLIAQKPNVLIILADDLGYGDVQCYNPERGKIPTPHMDALAKSGMRFTDAHTSSGVCSPTRYALLTGRYHWRTRLQSGIVPYLGAPLIAPERVTIADVLKQQGYRTAMVGKWHLGWDWGVAAEERALFAPPKNGAREVTDAHRAAWQRVYGARLGGGPLACGFDEYFGVDVPNWPPFTFIEGDRITAMPDEFLPGAQLTRLLASQEGPALKGWKLEAVLPALADRACAVIEAAAKKPEPFFLYLPLTAPHTPIAPISEWRGKSGLGDYADFVMHTDAVVGRVLAALEKSGAAENTLVIFTSDNGCAPYIGVKELEAKGHFPSGPWRGYKADAWEGGHRVPFVVRWPGTVAAGSRCDALVQQTDIIATLADILKTKLPPQSGEDSVSLVPLLKGGTAPAREYAISEASSGLPALRKGSWKIIFGQNGGGFGGAPGIAETGQLYDLAADPAETKNLWPEKPGFVAELTAKMEELVAAHTNDVPVKWRRFLRTEIAPAK